MLFSWEAIMAFVLVVVVYAVAIGDPSFGAMGPLAIGLSLLAMVFAGEPIACCPALPCPALPCPALPCPALPCPALVLLDVDNWTCAPYTFASSKAYMQPQSKQCWLSKRYCTHL